MERISAFWMMVLAKSIHLRPEKIHAKPQKVHCSHKHVSRKISSYHQIFPHVFFQCKLVKAQNDRLKKVLLTLEIVL